MQYYNKLQNKINVNYTQYYSTYQYITEWRRLQNEELYCLYSSPYIVRVIKSIRLRWAGHVARMEEDRSVSKMLTGKLTGK